MFASPRLFLILNDVCLSNFATTVTHLNCLSSSLMMQKFLSRSLQLVLIIDPILVIR